MQQRYKVTRELVLLAARSRGMASVFFFAFTLVSFGGERGVVINEIMYHAPDDLDDLQYVELHNAGDQPVDLGGWAIKKGVKFKFPSGTRIEPRGFLVICRSAERFKEFYKTPVGGVFDSTIRHKGERIELEDAAGTLVDAVKFKDGPPWPTGPDGYSGSLERISPDSAGDDAANWASSPLSEDRDKPAGTPGAPNAAFSAQRPPLIENVTFAPKNPAPNQAFLVEADVQDSGALASVSLLFRRAGSGSEKPEAEVAMRKASGNHFTATIPGQPAEQLIRFRIQAVGAGGAKRLFPAVSEPRSALSVYVAGPVEPAKIPFGWIVYTTEAELKAGQERGSTPSFGAFGPGGPPREGPPQNPLDHLRSVARKTLERELDLSFAWFELTGSTTGVDAKLSKLRAVFLAKLEERNLLIEERINGAKTEEDLQIPPGGGRLFLQSLADVVRPHLDESQNSSFASWLKRQSTDATEPGARMIRSRVDVEGVWHALSLNTELPPPTRTEVRQILRGIEIQRRALIEEVVKGQGKDTAFRDQRSRAETLGEQLATTLRPQLPPASAKEFDAWRGRPREITVGFRASPSRGGGFPGGFPGGPGGPGGREAAEAGSHRSAFVYFDPITRERELFDFVQITPRKGGQKIHFQKDRPFEGMTSIALIFEGETPSIVEALAYEVYRRTGMAAEQSYHVRLWQGGKPVGYHLLVEQPNRTFLRRHKIPNDGNLYKLLWYGNGVIGQHEKKTNTRTGHDDLVKLIDALDKTSGDAQWEVIRKEFDVDQVATYFAVNMVLSHWDGFFNNYFAYHEINGSGKWTMYPWDQDSTWGLRDVAEGGELFYTMSITFGMNGDSRPADGGQWRPPGFFSGPLLANPQFRKIFLARTKQILETVYTEDAFAPIIAELGLRLEQEVKLRAEFFKSDPAAATRALKANLEGCLEHLRKRRAFLLAQEEIKNAGTFSQTNPGTASSQQPAKKKQGKR